MPNKNVFKTARTGRNVTKATGETSEGLPAYELHPEQALAELACVGTFQNTYYNDASMQLDAMLSLAEEVSDEFLAKLAVYSREKAYMKDMPAALLALLSTRDTNLFNKVAPRILTNPRMIRGFVQIMRSGTVGRTSLGSAPKKRVQEAIQKLPAFMLLNGSVGNDPSLADVIKMVHPKPIGNADMSADEQQNAFAWIVGKEWNYNSLPRIFQEYEAFKTDGSYETPKVNFRLIDGLPTMTDEHWNDLGYTMNWTTLRMNLNTLARHGAFKDKALVNHAANLLSDPEKVKASMCFPYQILTAYSFTEGTNVPEKVRNALQNALDISLSNVPTLPGRVLVTVDVSGSMTAPIMQKSRVSCMEVGCLFGAVVAKNNPESVVTAFEQEIRFPKINKLDSLATITHAIASSGRLHSTNWSAALNWALCEEEKFDAIIWFSDMEANIDNIRYGEHRTGYTYEYFRDDGTAAAKLLDQYRRKVNKDVKIITVNLVPNRGHAQVDGKFDPNILQIGGFSDQVFDVIHSFIEAKEPGHWVKVIMQTEI